MSILGDEIVKDIEREVIESLNTERAGISPAQRILELEAQLKRSRRAHKNEQLLQGKTAKRLTKARAKIRSLEWDIKHRVLERNRAVALINEYRKKPR